MSLETNYYGQVKPAKPISKSDAEKIYKKFIRISKFINPETGNKPVSNKTKKK